MTSFFVGILAAGFYTGLLFGGGHISLLDAGLVLLGSGLTLTLVLAILSMAKKE